MEQITFRQLVQEYANIFWNGNFQNAINADEKTKESKNFSVENADLHNKFEDFARDKIIDFVCKIYLSKEHEKFGTNNYGRRYLSGRYCSITEGVSFKGEPVVITDNSFNKVLLTLDTKVNFTNTIEEERKKTCRWTGHVSRFKGKIKSCSISWGALREGNRYDLFFQHIFDRGYPQMNLSIEIEIDCGLTGSEDFLGDENYKYSYKGEDFLFPHGVQFYKREPQAATSSSGKIGCFVATACYGNYDAPEVLVLRRFRDEKLLNTTIGKVFVSIYYFTSPFFANIIVKSDLLKNIVRKYFLEPIINKIDK